VTTLAEAAVLIARRGSRVFPVGSDKTPRTPNGHHDGTTDLETIQGWRWDGGIGLVIPPRVFVVDVDPRNGGDVTLEHLPPLERTRTVRTQSGGRHFYFRLPDDRDLRGKLGPGIDIKKPGRGYVLVPPTPGYCFLRGGRPAPAPEWLLDELTLGARSEGKASAAKYFPMVGGTAWGLALLRNSLERVRNAGEGGRRATLNAVAFTLAGAVAGGELNEDKTLEKLLAAALDTGLTEPEALSRIYGGWESGLQKPMSSE
jgi:hypothetical protein